ncbi:cobaltochelatase subunit CobN [Jiella sp. MQZ9-1]|uniref:Cobaltochelatase subunit CobN n=1 Tax=Jiella flava TaxID=2816857 RepID=A0A939G0I4_9HYPH|nr:cobaltochelatase subunit CobN [Jiella flava]MBO0663551.1 cobaltochelatase subunit CobN [Jiella flava]MCD2472126.1 cobaltochelatase subunit CobN [Jiella flava]
MHLLLAQKGTIDDGGEAVDLGQSPGEIVVLSAADTEIAALASAAHRLGWGAGALRLANLLRLKHPMSVDAYVERTLRQARLVVVRLLGGQTYWPYGLDALLANAQAQGSQLAVLPGDDKPDPALDAYTTIALTARDRLWRSLIEGGPANAEGFLRGCRAVLGAEAWPGDAIPLLKAGVVDIGAATESGAGSGAAQQPVRPSDRPFAAIVCYRALVQSGQTGPIAALVAALAERGVAALPVFVASLKDPVSVETVRGLFARRQPDVVINLTGFAVSSPASGPGAARVPTVLEEQGAVVLQAVLASGCEETWRDSAQGLSARDLAMSVALPELDGRVLSRAIAFKSAGTFDPLTETDIVAHCPVPDRVAAVAELAARWARLRHRPNRDKRIAILLANYPNRDGRLGNGVGLDTPAGTIEVLYAMRQAGYPVEDLPDDGNGLIAHLMAGPTNAGTAARVIRETMALDAYQAFFARLPESVRSAVIARWGAPERDPFVISKNGRPAFALPLARFGKTLVGIQPARGYNIDPKETYHSPDLVPPHNYLALYAFLRDVYDADAVVHMGKHGNLEWLPGKALALSAGCFPEAVFGPLPHLYPFIVNDPGEGTQAKRRTSAVIIDHLTPPLTRAESYGPLQDLEALVDEYYAAAGGDPRRLTLLKSEILGLVRDIGLDHDAGIGAGENDETALAKLDAYLCDLKEMQIRDGLHVFGRAPEGRLLTDLVVALARLPRGHAPGEASLIRALAADLKLNDGSVDGETSADAARGTAPARFDPLDCDMAATWAGPRPDVLAALSADPWRSTGDTVERLELLAAELVSAGRCGAADWPASAAVLDDIAARLAPAVTGSGEAEIAGLLTGLDGRFVPPGPSGAPTRGRPDVLPTGRNFFSVDTRAVPTEAAYRLGRRSAELLVVRHLQDHGEWPTALGLSAWGTSNMRTGGDDIAQALALIGVKPVWDRASRRVTGYEIMTLAELGRPRVDVTLRISGFFRDAFPDQIALFDRAVRSVGALSEEAADNPISARMAREQAELIDAGASEAEAKKRSGFRVFGSKPGAYGAGLQALIDEKGWDSAADLAESYLVWGSYAYGADAAGEAERGAFEQRLSGLDAVVHNQDNREHDLLDSDDYYQFEGGMSVAVEHLTGARPVVYHNDHSRPERPIVRTLDEEIGRVIRARVVNPKWIAGVMRHGYKGAFEIAATVDYMFAFAATTGAVRDHHFEAAYNAFLMDEPVCDFLRANNPAALDEIRDRFAEAIARGLWKPRSNSARAELRGPSPR